MKLRRNLLTLAYAWLAGSGWAWAQEPPAPQRVTFTTQDGVKIVGDFYDAGAGGDQKPAFVILLHMYMKDRTSWAPLIPELTRSRISVLAIDLRGHGESTEVVEVTPPADEEEAAQPPDEERETEEETPKGPTGSDLVERVKARDKKVFKAMTEDVWSAYEWLAKSGKVDLARFGLVGASVGCTVAMDYASRDKSVDVVYCLSPGTKYMGLRSGPHIKKLADQAVMLVSNPEERKESEELKKNDENAELNVTLGKNGERDLHGTDMLGKVENLEAEMAGYLTGHLGSPSDPKEMVVGNIKTRVYFKPDMAQAQKLPERVRRWFSSPEEAESRGMKPGGGLPPTPFD